MKLEVSPRVRLRGVGALVLGNAQMATDRTHKDMKDALRDPDQERERRLQREPTVVLRPPPRPERQSSSALEQMESVLSANSLTEKRFEQHTKRLSDLVLSLATQYYEVVERQEDASGALITHCLLLSNTEASRRLAMALFEAHPRLLLRVHSHA